METRKNVTNALWLIGQPLLLNVLGVPATAYIIRALGPLGYGQWAVGASLVATLTFLTNLGLRTLFVREVAREPQQAARLLGEQLGLRMLLALAAGLLVIPLCLLLGYRGEVVACVAITALGLLFSSLSYALADVLQGLQRFSAYAGVSMISGLLLTALTVVAMWQSPKPSVLAFAYLSGPLCSLLLFHGIVRKNCFPVRVVWGWARFRELLAQCRTLGANTAFLAVQDRVEQLLVPKVVGITNFGFFSAGILPADRLATVPDGLATAFYPVITRHYRDDEKGAAQQVMQLFIISLVITLPLAILIAFLADPISALLFPGKAEVCRHIMRAAIWSLPFLGFVQPMTCALQAAGRYSEAAARSIRAGMCSLLCSLLLVTRFGIAGACVSWVLRPVMLALFLFPVFLRAYPTVLPRIPLARVVSCSLLMALPLWGVNAFPGEPTLPLLIAGTGLALLVYVAALLMLRVFETSALRQMLRRKVSTPVE